MTVSSRAASMESRQTPQVPTTSELDMQAEGRAVSGASEVETDGLDRGATGGAARGVAQGIAGRAVHFGVSYLASVVLARRLGPAAFGTYGIVMSVLLLLQQIGKSTLAPAAAKLIPEERERPIALEQSAFALNALFFIGLFALLWVGAPFIAALLELPEGGGSLIRLAALDLPLFGAYAIYRGILLGHRRFLATSMADAVYSIAKLAAVVGLLALSLSITSALLANVLASAGALLFVMSRISLRLGPPEKRFMRPLLRFALPLGFYMLALQTTWSLDLWFLNVLGPAGLGAATIGLYVAARNVAVVPSVVFMVISDVLLPSLSRAVAAGDTDLAARYVQGGVRFLFIVMVPTAILVMLAADHIMLRLYSERFEGGGIYLQVLVWYSVSLAFIDLFAAALSARGEPSLSGIALSSLIPLAVLLNVGLVPAYGPVGAALAAVLSGACGAVALGVLVHRRFGSLITRRTLVNTAIAVFVMLSLASQITGSGALLPIAYAGCFGVYVVGLVVLGEVTREDLAPIASWRSS